MNEYDEAKEKSEYYVKWLKANKTNIPNCERLIKLLKSDKKAGHIIHAEFVKRFVEGKKFKVTDVEKKNGHDVDIELDGSINIQVWHGASVSTYNIRKNLENAKPEKILINGREMMIRQCGGGVETNCNKDEEKINEKLKQLPDENLGLLICYNYSIGINVLPEWEDNIPANKVIAELFHVNYGEGIQNEARLYHSNKFKDFDLVKEILHSLGFLIKTINSNKNEIKK